MNKQSILGHYEKFFEETFPEENDSIYGFELELERNGLNNSSPDVSRTLLREVAHAHEKIIDALYNARKMAESLKEALPKMLEEDVRREEELKFDPKEVVMYFYNNLYDLNDVGRSTFDKLVCSQCGTDLTCRQFVECGNEVVLLFCMHCKERYQKAFDEEINNTLLSVQNLGMKQIEND